MKKYWKILVLSGILCSTMALIPNICNAQLGGPDEDPDAPIDGGVGILIAAGVGYGIKKYRDSGKKEKEAGL